MIPGEPKDPQLRDAIQECRDCHAACISTERSYMAEGGTDEAFILLLQDTAGVCLMTEESLLRGSEFSGRLTGLCADICERCADRCEQHRGDPVVSACLEACRRCVQACRRVSGVVAAFG